MKRHPLATTAAAIGLASFLFLFLGVGNPNRFFYDEGQYVLSARALLSHTENPNPEAPPLGKLLLAAGIHVLGDNAYGWRVPSLICGALTVVAIYLWTFLLLRDQSLALLAAGLTLFDNFLFVMSRIGMMDAFLVVFLFWGLVAFTAALELDEIGAWGRRALLVVAGAMFGFACACKWNGVDELIFAVGLVAALLVLAKQSSSENIARYASNLRQAGLPSVAVGLIVIPALAYAVTFWPLCRSLGVPFGVRQLIDMNLYIWRFHVATLSNPTVASPWYTWPLKFSPHRGLSYLVGNYIVMWSGLVALVFCSRRFWKSLPECMVVVLYLGNLMQWAITPTKHIYYYYYYPAALLLGVAIAIALKALPERIVGVRLSLAVFVATVLFFAYCYPRMMHFEAPWDCVFGCWN